MRRILIATLLAGLFFPVGAQELPQFPKAGPPEPLPEAACDTTSANNGEWLVGRWVSPQTKWSFVRQGQAIAWTMERKSALSDGFGWQEGSTITGMVDKVSGCTVTMSAGEGRFVFEGVQTEGGKLYGFATNPKGDRVRFTLRREK